jgi:DNA mismatch repair protein MutS2
LGSLKQLPLHAPGFENASMCFHYETLAPTYQLRQGTPGTSHALSIADRLGLDKHIIQQAEALMASDERNTALLLAKLSAQQQQVQEELQRAKAYRQEQQTAYEALETQRFHLEQTRKQLLHQLKATLKDQTHDLHTQLKRLRKRLPMDNKKALHPAQLSRMRHQLQQIDRHTEGIFTSADVPLAPLPQADPLPTLQVGQTVFCKALNLNVEVLAIQGNSVKVASGTVKANVRRNQLEARKAYHPKPVQTASSPYSGGAAGQRPSAHISSLTCDVRGQSTEDALATVGLFLDQALLAGLGEVSIIHGLGTGALKQAIRQFLQTQGFIKQFYPAAAVDGGDGKTCVILNLS